MAANLTRYAIFAAELVEYFSCRASAAVGYIVEAFAYALFRISAVGKFQKALIGLGILDHGGSFTIHSQHHGALGLLQPLHEVAGCPSKRRERLNVFGNIQHIASRSRTL